MPHESPEFETRLHELLDNRQSPEDDAWVNAQTDLSQEQREFLAGQQLMLDGLEMCDVPALPDDFAEQCVAVAMADKDARPSVKAPESSPRLITSTWQFSVALACVALVIVAAVPLWSWLTEDTQPAPIATNPPTENEPVVEVTPMPEAPVVAVDEIDRPEVEDESDDTPPVENVAQGEDPIDDPLSDPQYEDLYEMFRELRNRIPPAEGEENLLALRPQWVDDMATGLRPVADSVGGALNAIRRNIPPTPKVDGDEKPQAWVNPSRASELS